VLVVVLFVAVRVGVRQRTTVSPEELELGTVYQDEALQDVMRALLSADERGDAQLHLQYHGAATLARLGVPRFRIGRALHMWLRYNACIADFAERHPERCHVVRADDLASAGPRLVAALAATGVPLRAAEADGAIQAGLLTRRAAPAIERRCRRSPAVAALLGRLEALADRPPDHA